MGWSSKYKKSIDCNNPKGFSQKAHCQGRKKRNENIMKLSEFKEAVREISRKKFYESLNEASITKTYIAFMALKKKIKELEEEQLKMLKQWKGEKDPKRKKQILDKMKSGTKVLQKQRGYLNKLETEYINNMSYDTSYSE